MSRTRATAIASFHDAYEPEPNTGCWLWTRSVDHDGYGYFKIGGETRAHRASWAIHFGPVPEGRCVLHRCDTPACVNPQHFFLGSNEENTADRHRKRRDAAGLRNGSFTRPQRRPSGERNGKQTKPERTPRGQVHGMHILTEEQALAILHSGEPTRVLAARHGVSKYAVQDIRARRSWRHLA
jgi:hypothetical protein